LGWLIVLLFASLLVAASIHPPQPTLGGGGALAALRGPKRPAKPRASAIAVVEIDGPIAFASRGGAERIVRRLRTLRENNDVRAVILRINSPGGSVAATQEIYEELLTLRRGKKVVVASFGDVAASGGYYIACAAQRIVANPGTITGSIGVIMQVTNVTELFEKIGVRAETIKSGAMKDAGSPYRRMTEEDRRVFQGLVGDAYRQFRQAVSEGRQISPEKLDKIADGRVFTGAQAMEVGLVDVLGGFQTAIDETRRIAGIRDPQPTLLYSATPWDKMFGFLENRMSWARSWVRFFAPGGPRLEYLWD
jgi:protease-4